MTTRKETSRNDADTIRISAMLICVVVAYIVFILPITVVHNLAFWKGVSAFDTNTFDFFVLREVARILEQLNYSTNFLLYVLCFTKFRERVFELLRNKKLLDYRQKRRESANRKTESPKQQAPSSGVAQEMKIVESGKKKTTENEPAVRRNQNIVNPDAIFINTETTQ